jgi:rhodanese-related sulfurtransferase
MFYMKNLKFILTLFLLPLFFSSCYHVDDTIYGSVDKMVMETKSEIKFVNAGQLDEMTESQMPGLRIVDIREPNEYIAGHIPGAINVPRGVLEFSSQLTNRREKVVLYSDSHNRSSLASDNLKLLKFDHVQVLEGGLGTWKEMFPEKIEEGIGSAQVAAPAKPASSGGCGD